jgi:hypothetical protein
MSLVCIGRQSWNCIPLIAASHVETAVMVHGGLRFEDKSPARVEMKHLEITRLDINEFVALVVCLMRGDGGTSVELFVKDPGALSATEAADLHDLLWRRALDQSLVARPVGFGRHAERPSVERWYR